MNRGVRRGGRQNRPGIHQGLDLPIFQPHVHVHLVHKVGFLLGSVFCQDLVDQQLGHVHARGIIDRLGVPYEHVYNSTRLRVRVRVRTRLERSAGAAGAAGGQKPVDGRAERHSVVNTIEREVRNVGNSRKIDRVRNGSYEFFGGCCLVFRQQVHVVLLVRNLCYITIRTNGMR